MPRAVLQLRYLLAACLMQACTHYYIPVSESASRQDREALQKLDLKGTAFTIECRWKPAYGKVEPAHKMCNYLSKLLIRLNATVEDAESEDNEGDTDSEDAEDESLSNDESEAKLKLQVELRSMPEKYSAIDHTLLWLTYGLFPASTDAWHVVDARVLDERGLVVEQGEYKALFRTWKGWGYRLADEAMRMIKREAPREPHDEASSQDFYAFVGHIVYDAAMAYRQSEELKGEGAPP